MGHHLYYLTCPSQHLWTNPGPERKVKAVKESFNISHSRIRQQEGDWIDLKYSFGDSLALGFAGKLMGFSGLAAPSKKVGTSVSACCIMSRLVQLKILVMFQRVSSCIAIVSIERWALGFGDFTIAWSIIATRFTDLVLLSSNFLIFILFRLDTLILCTEVPRAMLEKICEGDCKNVVLSRR